MPKAKKRTKRGPGFLGASIDRVGPTVLRQLASPEMPMGDIAKSKGLNVSTVGGINKKYGARPAEIVKDIAHGITIAKSKAVYRKRLLGKKVNRFSEAQKLKLLEANRRIIGSVAKKWWNSALIKREFGNFDSLVQAINKHVFDKLDYYNPEVKGKGGKVAQPSTWIYKGAKLFCMASYRMASRRKGKIMPVDKKGLPIAQTGEVRTTKGLRLEPKRHDLQWIPFSANFLLKKLGLDPNNVAKLGFGNIKRQLIEISRAGETGLTSREKKIIKMRLDGKKTEDVAEAFSMSRQNISLIESRAAKKIREQIKKRKARKLMQAKK